MIPVRAAARRIRTEKRTKLVSWYFRLRANDAHRATRTQTGAPTCAGAGARSSARAKCARRALLALRGALSAPAYRWLRRAIRGARASPPVEFRVVRASRRGPPAINMVDPRTHCHTVARGCEGGQRVRVVGGT